MRLASFLRGTNFSVVELTRFSRWLSPTCSSAKRCAVRAVEGTRCDLQWCNLLCGEKLCSRQPKIHRRAMCVVFACGASQNMIGEAVTQLKPQCFSLIVATNNGIQVQTVSNTCRSSRMSSLRGQGRANDAIKGTGCDPSLTGRGDELICGLRGQEASFETQPKWRSMLCTQDSVAQRERHCVSILLRQVVSLQGRGRQFIRLALHKKVLGVPVEFINKTENTHLLMVSNQHLLPALSQNHAHTNF